MTKRPLVVTLAVPLAAPLTAFLACLAVLSVVACGDFPTNPSDGVELQAVRPDPGLEVTLAASATMRTLVSNFDEGMDGHVGFRSYADFSKDPFCQPNGGSSQQKFTAGTSHVKPSYLYIMARKFGSPDATVSIRHDANGAPGDRIHGWQFSGSGGNSIRSVIYPWRSSATLGGGVSYWLVVKGSANDCNSGFHIGYTTSTAQAGETGWSIDDSSEGDGSDKSPLLFKIVASNPSPPAGERPTVTLVEIVSTPRARTDTYGSGETIEIDITFSEAVRVERLFIDINFGWGNRRMYYSESLDASDTDAVVTFAHVVKEPNLSTQGISVPQGVVHMFGARIESVSHRRSANTFFGRLPPDPDHKVDWRLGTARPAVLSVAITSHPGSDKTYRNGDVIETTAYFNEAVTVSGTPQVMMDISNLHSGSDKPMNYVSGGGSTALVFRYTVACPNWSTDGIAIPTNALRLNGGTIMARGMAAELAHAEVARTSLNPNHMIQTTGCS